MDIKDVGVIYSAVVATAALAWNIIHATNQRRGKLKVIAGYSYKMAQSPLMGRVIDLPPVIDISVTNRGSTVRHLNRPLVRFNSKVDGHDTFQFVQVAEQRSFPYPLEPGTVFKCEFELPKFVDGFGKQFNSDARFEVVIRDTMGKEYSSAPLKLAEAHTHLKLFVERLSEKGVG